MWWLVPLVVLGRYIFSFLPFIETASATTGVASLLNTLRGTSSWISFLPVDGKAWLPAAFDQATRPWLIAVTAAVAGMIYAGEIHGAVYTLGSNDLLTVLAGVVIGGTSLFGGKGSIFGALMGAVLMVIITNGLVLMGATVQQQILVNGIIIVIAVAVSQRQPQE